MNQSDQIHSLKVNLEGIWRVITYEHGASAVTGRYV